MRLPLAFILTCLAALTLPAASLASVSLTNVKLTPSTTQAGAHPDVTIDFGFDVNPTSDDLKSVGLVLPQGLVGDPNAADRCSEAKFTADACPAGSKVGTTSAEAVVAGLVTQTVPGDVVNLEPKGGEPARLGAILRPSAGGLLPLAKVFLQSGVSTGPDTNFGLKTVFDNLPRDSGGIDIRLTSMQLKLTSKAAHGQFLTNPTDCGEAKTLATVTSYDEPNKPVSGSSSFTPTGCDKLDFQPSLTGTIGGSGQTASGQSPTLTAVIGTRTGDSNPRRVKVTLPDEAAFNITSKATPCPGASFLANNCPAGSKVGSASASSPLLPAPLAGTVLLVSDPVTKLPAVGVQFGQPVPLALLGAVAFADGPISNTFDGIPDLPLARFQLTIDGGSTSSLLTNAGDLCKLKTTPVAKAELLSHSGKTANLTAPFAVQGCPPGSQTVASGGKGKPRAKLSLRFKRKLGTLRATFSSGKNGPRLKRARLALPKRLRTGVRGRKLPKGLKVTAGGHRLGRKSVRIKGHTLDVKLKGKGARSISVRWTKVKPSKSLGRKLRKRPRLTFVARLTEAGGRTTRLRLTVRPAVKP